MNSANASMVLWIEVSFLIYLYLSIVCKLILNYICNITCVIFTDKVANLNNDEKMMMKCFDYCLFL